MKLLTLGFMVIYFFYFQDLGGEKAYSSASYPNAAIHSTNEVLTILENKCNDCHLQKKRVVFTQNNMASWATKINEQVFIKKRMPKGKEHTLTLQELEVLRVWLDSVGKA